jgi:high-affinity Fe2+/Pb2+ permease
MKRYTKQIIGIIVGFTIFSIGITVGKNYFTEIEIALIMLISSGLMISGICSYNLSYAKYLDKQDMLNAKGSKNAKR